MTTVDPYRVVYEIASHQPPNQPEDVRAVNVRLMKGVNDTSEPSSPDEYLVIPGTDLPTSFHQGNQSELSLPSRMLAQLHDGQRSDGGVHAGSCAAGMQWLAHEFQVRPPVVLGTIACELFFFKRNPDNPEIYQSIPSYQNPTYLTLRVDDPLSPEEHFKLTLQIQEGLSQASPQELGEVIRQRVADTLLPTVDQDFSEAILGPDGVHEASFDQTKRLVHQMSRFLVGWKDGLSSEERRQIVFVLLDKLGQWSGSRNLSKSSQRDFMNLVTLVEETCDHLDNEVDLPRLSD